MKIAIAGLNPGTAIYAYYMAKNGHETTIYTNTQGDVIVMDLIPHTKLGIINTETTKLFTRKYLEDILGINIINTQLETLSINKNKVIDKAKDTNTTYDKVVIGTEATPRNAGNCMNIYNHELTKDEYIISGTDLGKNTETLLLITDLGGTATTKSPLALDEDIIKTLPHNKTQDTGQCLTTDYDVTMPITTEEHYDSIGRGLKLVDSLSGIDYVINRDYQLIIMGKLLALRDLGIVNSLSQIPRLEVGFSRNWSFITIGLTKSELTNIFRDLSSSRTSLHSSDSDITAKVLHRGRKLLSLQIITKGIRLDNWFYHIYSLVMLDKAPYLILDMGYERLFGTFKGTIEGLIMNIYNI
ncbi:MAG: hypothetical protein TU36_000445 [Vulcanisaeta sp. AZ3]|jgi:hypothetical protein|nr:MAG: hypothetical protein TU36_02960 [Vulcanisaeta sp. AZ3]